MPISPARRTVVLVEAPLLAESGSRPTKVAVAVALAVPANGAVTVTLMTLLAPLASDAMLQVTAFAARVQVAPAELAPVTMAPVTGMVTCTAPAFGPLLCVVTM